ncbi:MAG: hypothetical protein J5I93_04530 [Pirellulaceae bacterium]|nr:hypothetical protein [Pirellulaceae bacterium]
MNDDSAGEQESAIPEPTLPPVRTAFNPCPQCGARREAIEAACPGCGWAPPPPRNDADPPAVTWPMRAEAARTFSLESLMLVVTLVAVCLSVGVWVPGLGILLAVLSTPALVRTVVVQLRRKAQGQPLSVGEKLTTFLASLGFVVLIGVALLITLFFACLAIVEMASPSRDPVPASILLLCITFCGGVLAAIVVAVTWINKRGK